ncbi:tellurium resistance protein [Streptomyces scabiei]|uniref:vWA domain-containing protein n=1 Tax=Streptomyces scabiei TaxID=1930 RepID=UPI0029AFCB9D|nr:tellurium resistance protein [Streptomyces scabiei]MDX3521325.1 tellurium resistance protein [Streptomyces scabiei]
MSDIPGGPMATRPVVLYWLVDCSGSMSMNGKIGALNFAIREALPDLLSAAADNPAATLMMRVLAFSSEARWESETAVPIEDFRPPELEAHGATALGAALRLLAEELHTPPMPTRALRPVIVLISDGIPTDDWRAGLRALDTTPWGRRSLRVAIAVGDDADRGILQEFLQNPELEPLNAGRISELARSLRWASTMAVRASSSPTTHTVFTGFTSLPPQALGDDDEDVW